MTTVRHSHRYKIPYEVVNRRRLMLIALKNSAQEKTQKVEDAANFYCLIGEKSLLQNLVEIILTKEYNLLKFATLFALDQKHHIRRGSK